MVCRILICCYKLSKHHFCCGVRMYSPNTLVNPRRACAARVTVLGRVCVCLCVTSHFWSVCSTWKYCRVLSGQRRSKSLWVFFETAPFKSYGVKRKRKSQLLIRSSLLWLTSDQVFLFDVQQSTSGYCMREYKHRYCSGQSYSASSSVQTQP